MSPTQRTLARLRSEGWTAQVVEHWNAFARRRIDLFGVIDIVAVKPNVTLGIQTTSISNAATRKHKSLASPGLRAWLEAGNQFAVWGWRKISRGQKRPTWEPRVEVVTLEDFSGVLGPAP